MKENVCMSDCESISKEMSVFSFEELRNQIEDCLECKQSEKEGKEVLQDVIEIYKEKYFEHF